MKVKNKAYVYVPDYNDYIYSEFDYDLIDEFVFIVDDKNADKKLVNICSIDGAYLAMVNASNLHEIV